MLGAIARNWLPEKRREITVVEKGLIVGLFYLQYSMSAIAEHLARLYNTVK